MPIFVGTKKRTLSAPLFTYGVMSLGKILPS